MDSRIQTDARVEMQCDEGSIDEVDALAQLANPGWLSTALAEKYPGTRVEHAEIIRIAAGCSTKIWLDMDYNLAGRTAGLPSRLVLKAGFGRHDPIMMFTYEIEMCAYRDLLPAYPINSPHCYYAGKSPDGFSAGLILEDLTLRDVRFCHALTPLTFEECAAFMEALAVFHAKSWNDPVLAASKWAKDAKARATGLAAYLDNLLSPESWAKFTSLPRGTAVPRKLHDRPRFLEGLVRLQALGEKEAQVALMGDEHLGNLYIEKDGKPGFLDFQSRIASWAQGIAYFMGAALDILDRRAWERELLVRYLETLRANGVKPPSFEAAWDAYCREMLFGYMVWLTNGTQFQKETVNTANCARLATAVIDLDSFGRLGL